MNLLSAAPAVADVGFGAAGILALLGYGVVFLGLISLMVVITIMGKIFVASANRKKAEAPAPAEAAPVEAAPAPVAAPVAAPAAAPAGAAGSVQVKAPLQGTVMKVLVKPGDSVKKGSPVCVIEALKMENDVPAPADGVVASVNVKSGDSVKTDEVLLTLN